MGALLFAIFAAALAGFSRGFAAFGTAMVFVPLVTVAYDAETAVVTLFLVDLLPSIPLVWRAVARCDRGTVLFMSLGAIAGSPIGVMVLVAIDQASARIIVGSLLLAATSYMLLGKELRVSGGRLQSVAAGIAAGFAGGVCGIFGPLAILYLVGRSVDARTTRADAIVFVTGESLILGMTYAAYGLITFPRVQLALVLLPAYAAFIWLGAKGFSGIGETAYRRAILGLLCGVSALIIGQTVITLLS